MKNQYSSGTNSSAGITRVTTASGSVNFPPVSAGFPTPDQALAQALAVDRAMELVDAYGEPSETIRRLADRLARAQNMTATFMRLIGEHGKAEWRIVVRTGRGKVTAKPYLKEGDRIDDPDLAWMNALADVGLVDAS